jgi:hypothetical protein
LKIGADAVPQDRDGDLADVGDGHREAAVHGRQRFAAGDEELASPRASAPVDQLADNVS